MYFKKSNAIHLLLMTSLSGAVSAVGGENANAETGFVIEEIIVTAQKREQSLQKVGITISAFNEDTINKLGLDDMEQLAATVPNLQALERRRIAVVSFARYWFE